MARIHDSGYKRLFSNKVFFQQLLETFVDQDWVKDVDFNQVEALDKEHYSDRFQRSENDMIYRLKHRKSEVFVIIMLEFQSKPERFMAVRVLNYITSFYLGYREKHKNLKLLPPVFPIVLYNGNQKWTAPVKFNKLIRQVDILGKYSVDFQYFKIAENEFSREKLLKVGNFVSTLFLTETHFEPELIRNELLRLFRTSDDKESISLLINWFIHLFEHERITKEDFDRIEFETIEEVEVMVQSAIKKQKTEWKREGLQEGRQEGRQEAMQQIARTMLQNKEDLQKISKYTGLSIAVLEEMQRKAVY